MLNYTNQELYELGYNVMERVKIKGLQTKYRYMSSEEIKKREESLLKRMNELSDEHEIIIEALEKAYAMERKYGANF